MRLLFVHPGPLLFTNVFLRLEPLGLELVADAARRAGHAARLIDLQAESHADYHRLIAEWQPDFIAFSCNYLANVPEIVDLAKKTKLALPRCFICVGGHSASFTANAIVEHGNGAIDCVLKGEGEPNIVKLLEAVAGDRNAIAKVPGAITADGEGPRPAFVERLEDVRPARDMLRRRHKDYIGVLDPCASIEFSRGCPWDCSFCSAWTFYGRSYRVLSPERVVDELATIGSRAFSSLTTSRSFKSATAWRSAKRSPARKSAKDIISKHAATCCSETRRYSSSGSRLASPRCFLASKRSTRTA